jgi:hypothetical protein
MAEPIIKANGDKLLIEVDLTAEGTPSKSGNSIVIASTHGNIIVSTDSGPVTVGLNVYRKK